MKLAEIGHLPIKGYFVRKIFQNDKKKQEMTTNHFGVKLLKLAKYFSELAELCEIIDRGPLKSFGNYGLAPVSGSLREAGGRGGVKPPLILMFYSIRWPEPENELQTETFTQVTGGF